jgi:hypothetical protein
VSGPERSAEVLLVSSSGGVLLDVLALAPWWRDRPHRWVCVSAPDSLELLAGDAVSWQPELRPAAVLAVARAAVQALRSLRRQRVAMVVSAGSGIAVPWFLAAYLCRIPRVWVETFNVVGRPGLASRFCASLASAVLVQHPHLVARHRRAVLVGELY